MSLYTDWQICTTQISKSNLNPCNPAPAALFCFRKEAIKFVLSMALSFSFATPANSSLKLHTNSHLQYNQLNKKPNVVGLIKCESKDSPREPDLRAKGSKLEIGSPIIVTEAPKMIKTAATVPCLRVNSGLVKPGDVGRIVSRKPKDVWAVRLTIGTYLIDGKYFKPLDLAE
ncbi:hypothetical protein RIF29_17716 [Crotalaria pallida]|uniref:Chlororespiratory reduction 42 n=1 Tax=Crotalaria pallida TaxID=3830 RepID=A0AAN9FRD3_CROPI